MTLFGTGHVELNMPILMVCSIKLLLGFEQRWLVTVTVDVIESSLD